MGILGEAGSALVAGLGRACLGGGLFALAVWGVCRVLPRLPGAARFWLWWLVCAKLLVGLGCAASFTLTVALPVPRDYHPAAVHALYRRLAPAPVAKATPTTTALPKAEKGDEEEAAAAPPTAVTAAAAPTAVTAPRPLPVLTARDVFVAVWLSGVFLILVLDYRAARPLRLVLREAVLATGTPEIDAVVQAIGLRHPPRLLTSAHAPGPFVAGLLRPVLVLPERFGDGLTPEEIRMALAHELSHLKRGDIYLSLAPAVARVVFWFFPLAHLACRECAACREEAADAAALAVTGAAPVGYAQLLLKMVARQRGAVPLPPSLPMAAAHFRQVKRRLLAMQNSTTYRLRLAGAACVACGLAGVAPWRVTTELPDLEADMVSALAREEVSLPRYELTDLGTLGGRYSDAYAVGEDGTVVGTANVYPLGLRGHAFTWESGRMRDLTAGSLYRHSVATAVNEKGQVAALAFNSSRRPFAFLWDKGKRRYLGGLPGFRYSRALDISERGDVIGVAQESARDSGSLRARAFLWRSGRMQDLGTLGGPYSHALAINSQGHVVGKADLPRPGATDPIPTHAFWHDGERMHDLGTLGGYYSLASDINGRSQIVGASQTGDGVTHAFLSDRGASLRDLGTLSGADGSVAYSVNEEGMVVGAAYVGDSPAHARERRALLWLPVKDNPGTPRPVDLNQTLPPGSGWVLETARGINSHGQIVGQGMVNGQRRAFLLTPRP